MNDLELAKTTLEKSDSSLVIVRKGKIVFKTKRKGVTGFLLALEELRDAIADSSVADRVVGRAIALLCLYAKVRSIYAKTVSEKAKELLETTNVSLEYHSLVDNILSVDGVDVCPFEKAVSSIFDPKEAYVKLKSICRSQNQTSPMG